MLQRMLNLSAIDHRHSGRLTIHSAQLLQRIGVFSYHQNQGGHRVISGLTEKGAALD